MDVTEFVLALVFIVLGFITYWVSLFMKGRQRKERVPESDNRYNVKELSAIAQSLNERIDTLESLLDAEVPDWREQNEHTTQ